MVQAKLLPCKNQRPRVETGVDSTLYDKTHQNVSHCGLCRRFNVARFVTFDERLLVKHNQRRRQYYLYPLTVYVNVYIAVLYNGVNGWK